MSALNISHAFSATTPAGRYAPALRFIAAGKHSGIYAILDRRSRAVLYVGESHSGRLYDTITRHFRAWSIARGADAQGRRRGGEMYDRASVAIAFTLTPAALAQETQYAAIQALRPRDNAIDGCGSHPTAACGVDDLPV